MVKITICTAICLPIFMVLELYWNLLSDSYTSYFEKETALMWFAIGFSTNDVAKHFKAYSQLFKPFLRRNYINVSFIKSTISKSTNFPKKCSQKESCRKSLPKIAEWQDFNLFFFLWILLVEILVFSDLKMFVRNDSKDCKAM